MSKVYCIEFTFHYKVKNFSLHLCKKSVLVQSSHGSQAMDTPNAKMLESVLPSKFQYKIKEVKILEQSKVKFHASFEANICTKEDAEELFLFFVIASKKNTKMKARRKEKMRIGFNSNRFNCGKRIRDERSAKDSDVEKRSGQGWWKG